MTRELAAFVLASIVAVPAGAQAGQAMTLCSIVAHEQGLTGKAYHQSVQLCFASDDPTLSKMRQCRRQGRANGVGVTGMATYVRSCVYGQG